LVAAENRTGTSGKKQRVTEYVLIVLLTVATALIGLVIFSVQIGDVLSLIADTIHT
jgi:hypothetical protein